MKEMPDTMCSPAWRCHREGCEGCGGPLNPLHAYHGDLEMRRGHSLSTEQLDRLARLWRKSGKAPQWLTNSDFSLACKVFKALGHKLPGAP